MIPDIVTMTKAIRKGLPLATVVTTPKIAKFLCDRIHFNTFGGNPVSPAVGKAVLEVIERKNLQQKRLETGATWADEQSQHHR